MENNKKINVSLGFDLGIGSVGWAIINNDNNEVLDLGSRLFNEPELAVKRRGFRAVRRSIRRKKFKSMKFSKLVFKYRNLFGLEIKHYEEVQNIYLEMSKAHPNILEIKTKALANEISSKQLIWILHDHLKNRGAFFETVESTDKGDKKDEKEMKVINTNEFPSHLQAQFYEKNKWYNGMEAYDNQHFSNKMWLRELEKIFEVQKDKYDSNLFNEFKKEYLNLFNFLRAYQQGPGSINSYSPYGIYEHDENNKLYKKYDAIWEKTIGKCSIFINENRAPKNLPSAELYDVLSDLNNIRCKAFPELKLDKKDKKEIIFNELIKEYLNKKNKNITNTMIVKYLKSHAGLEEYLVTIETLKNDDKKYNELKTISRIIKIFVENNGNLSNIKFETYHEWLEDFDRIFMVLFETNQLETRIEKLNNLLMIFKKYFANEDDIKNAINEIASDPKFSTSKTHSISHKAISLALDDIFEGMSLSALKFDNKSKLGQEYQKEIANKKEEDSKNVSKYLNSKFLDDAILPPAVKNTMYESIKIFNKIVKKYGNVYNIEKIGMEMPRDKNSEEERKKIHEQNKKNEKRAKLIEDEYFVLTGKNNFKWRDYNSATKEKLLLYCQQDGWDVYVGEKMDIERVILEPNYAQIDHIIPESISFDNSNANKVLVLASSNQNKGNRVPKEYLDDNQFEEMKNKLNLWLNKDNNFFDSKRKDYEQKRKNLLHDPINDEDKLGFVQRNLNDTRYASKLFLEELYNYSKLHDKQFTITPIRGRFTSLVRKFVNNKIYHNRDDKDNKDGFKFVKDRNEFSHHAIDASILAIAANNMKPFWGNEFSFEVDKFYVLNKNVINSETGEVVCKLEDYTRNLIAVSEKVYDSLIKDVKNPQLNEILAKTKYSRKITKDYNIELFNSSLYSYREVDDKNIQKIERKSIFDIYAYLENEEKQDKILMKKSHPKEFEDILNIWKEYQQSSKPFDAYTQKLFEEYAEQLCKDPNKFREEAKAFLNSQNRRSLLIKTNNGFKSIKKVKILGDIIAKDNVHMIKKQNYKSFKGSFNWAALLIYKNKKDEFTYIPVNAKIYKFDSNIKPNFADESTYMKEALEYEKEKNKIPKENKIIDVFYKGTTLTDFDEEDPKKRDIYIVGATSQKIEYKYCSHLEIDDTKNKDKPEIKRFIKTTSVLLKKYTKNDKNLI
ncbi:type II CRISPR RNA-guided endonuclease Cas9 [Mycoplasma phocoeninasale]|uniref:CRISPR-associated endonuclease Cas9 n=1 Tax=Mycoplasma phocoeninasale TaxID=2726117 RepID=A0A858TZB6_9MOLU|nr:type II CRISPR RNA-guided endonuclease Cas9 [Mycoplasma phocoeninasale]QJG66134.1 type II CRISPR RNA-guided endonuclease Cas9 [Mycoplasma phocoeninasale]